jgi:hypothetical protein
MKKELCMITTLLCAVMFSVTLLLASCASAAPAESADRQPPVDKPPSALPQDEAAAATETPQDAESQDELYPSIPPYALEEAEQYKAEFLTENAESASDLTYRFFYDEDGGACLEYTITPQVGYIWEPLTSVGKWWSGSTGSIGNGEIHYTKTKKNADQAQARIEKRRTDPAFAELEKIALQIAADYDCDFYAAMDKW